MTISFVFRLLRQGLVLAVLCLLPTGAAFALGERITDVRVRENARTSEDTIRAMAGLDIGDRLEPDTLDLVRERLNTSGLFSDVDVYWEPHGAGVRVVIKVRDKFPWAPLPTFSLSPGNISFGLVVVHGNLFRRGKQGLIGGRISNVDSGALFAYRDPALFGSWAYYQLQARFADQVVPEYSNVKGVPLRPLRSTALRSYGGDMHLGVAWFRRLKTHVGWHLEQFNYRKTEFDDMPPVLPDPPLTTPAMPTTRAGFAYAVISFDFRAREQAVMTGNALTAGFERGSPGWGSSDTVRWWKGSVSFEQGVKLFRSHNLYLRTAGIVGDNLPLWAENNAGGTNLRGYLYQQFRGDTHLTGRAEYHFPIFSVGPVQLRGLTFYDAAAIWYRKLPPIDPVTGFYEVRRDGRSYLPPAYLREGFDPSRDIHHGVGGGIRFYVRSVAVPLVGLDGGYSLRDHLFRILIVVGA